MSRNSYQTVLGFLGYAFILRVACPWVLPPKVDEGHPPPPLGMAATSLKAELRAWMQNFEHVNGRGAHLPCARALRACP